MLARERKELRSRTNVEIFLEDPKEQEVKNVTAFPRLGFHPRGFGQLKNRALWKVAGRLFRCHLKGRHHWRAGSVATL